MVTPTRGVFSSFSRAAGLNGFTFLIVLFTNLSLVLLIDEQLLFFKLYIWPLQFVFVFSISMISMEVSKSRCNFGLLLVWSFMAWNFSLPGIAQWSYNTF